jgi:putative ABC transport system permease protein
MPPSALSGASSRTTLFILFGAVGCVLLIACANVAHLVLARNTVRRREIAVRVAIGASAGRLARQLFFENLLLALVGAAAGLGIGLWGVQAISAIRPPQMRQLADMRVTTPVFAFGFGLALLTSLVFGLLPSITSARRPAAEALKHGGASLGSPRAARVRRVLTVAEIALALVLLTGAGLLLRSYAKVLSTDRGFRPDHLVAVKLELPPSRYASPAAMTSFTTRATETISAAPGIKRVVVASAVPPAGGLIFASGLDIEGRESPMKDASMFGGGFVQPGFFEALTIPLREGRTFAETDLKQQVVVINERAA